MSGKPAARITDPTACPVPGHGTNPLVDGSPDVFYDSLSAARLGDKSACGSPVTQAVSSTVFINGKPAATLGSVGAHGNTVISGSGTVIIGDVAIGGASPMRTLTTDDKGMGSGGNHEAEPDASRADGLGKETNHVASAQSSPQSFVNGDDSSNEQVSRDEQEPPVVNLAEDRWESIVNNTPAVFEIADNPNASGQEPWYAFDAFEEVNENEQEFEAVGREVGVEPRLLKAIAYIETTHGYYDRIHPRNTSFRPMNINYEYWKPIAVEAGFTRYEVVNYPYPNIYVAAVLLKRIQARVVPSSIEKVASIYNALGAEHVNDYGARVQSIYDQKLWEGGGE